MKLYYFTVDFELTKAIEFNTIENVIKFKFETLVINAHTQCLEVRLGCSDIRNFS